MCNNMLQLHTKNVRACVKKPMTNFKKCNAGSCSDANKANKLAELAVKLNGFVAIVMFSTDI